MNGEALFAASAGTGREGGGERAVASAGGGALGGCDQNGCSLGAALARRGERFSEADGRRSQFAVEGGRPRVAVAADRGGSRSDAGRAAGRAEGTWPQCRVWHGVAVLCG